MDEEVEIRCRELVHEKLRLERTIKGRALNISQLRSDIKSLKEVLEKEQVRQQLKELNETHNSDFDPEHVAKMMCENHSSSVDDIIKALKNRKVTIALECAQLASQMDQSKGS